MVVSSSSDDDGLVAPPSLRDVMPRPAMPAGAETREMRWMRQVMATAPGGVQASSIAMTHVVPTSISWAAAEAPKIIVAPPMVSAQAATVVPETTRMTLAVAVETPSGSGGGPTGSWRGSQFQAAQRESQL